MTFRPKPSPVDVDKMIAELANRVLGAEPQQPAPTGDTRIDNYIKVVNAGLHNAAVEISGSSYATVRVVPADGEGISRSDAAHLIRLHVRALIDRELAIAARLAPPPAEPGPQRPEWATGQFRATAYGDRAVRIDRDNGSGWEFVRVIRLEGFDASTRAAAINEVLAAAHLSPPPAEQPPPVPDETALPDGDTGETAAARAAIAKAEGSSEDE